MGMPSRRTNNFPESGRGLGHVTPTIFGSTVGYPSDSSTSCFNILFYTDCNIRWFKNYGKVVPFSCTVASYGQTTDKIVRTIITEFDARLTQKSLAYFRSTWTWYLSILGVTWTVTFLSTFSSFRPMAHDTIDVKNVFYVFYSCHVFNVF